MSHNHKQGDSHGPISRPTTEREKKIYKVTLIGSFVNFLLVVFKFAAGFIGHSGAMVADAVHSLSDFVTDIIVIIFVRVSGKPRDLKHNYGHGKYETLATLIISVILLGIGAGIAYGGISDIVAVARGAVLPSPGMLAFYAALISIAAKEAIYRYTMVQGRKLNSDAMIANAWHHRSDALSSIGTAVGIGGAIFFGEKWTVLDPIAAVVVSFFIIRIALQLLKPAIDELMERSLPEEVGKDIEEIAASFPEISDIHNLCTRKIGNKYAIELHMKMDGGMTVAETHRIVSMVEAELRKRFGENTHVIVHVEPLDGGC